MTGEGLVVEITGSKAKVRIEKKSACSGECSSCGLCNNPVYDVEAINKTDAKVGDRVKLFMPTKKVVGVAFLIYMAPILAVFLIMGICTVLNINNYINTALCLTAILSWFLLLRLFNKKADLKNVITEVIGQENEI